MLENFKIAVKKQKKLVFIFFLTIFLPSVSLSIFGISAIRNERFRLAKQLENEHRRTADFIKSQISSQLREMESNLQNLAQLSSFSDRDYSAIRDLLKRQYEDHNLIDHVFFAYGKEEPLFPLFQKGPVKTLPSPASFFKSPQREKLKRAEELEFEHKRYKEAISLYKELFGFSGEKHFRGQILNNEARCRMKAKEYSEAIENYQRIIKEYPESLSSSEIPLALISRLQIVHCFRALGDTQNSLENSLDLYRKILQMTWDLSEVQFMTYSSLAEEAIFEILSEEKNSFSFGDYQQELEQLQILYRKRIGQWQVINDIKQEIIPELQRRFTHSEGLKPPPLRYSKTVRDTDFLILAAMIPSESGKNSGGLLGIKIKDEYLRGSILSGIIENIQFSETTNVVISDLSGKVLLGEKNPATELATVTDFFEDSFPPWKIEFFRNKTSGLGIVDIRKSFYFWTIITLIVVLTFGSVLIVRNIAHEMEILKIKSDFVSSISHEFKTPLTSIKALTERLQEGKVKDAAKLQEYFSVISHDTDKLTRLVRNILDFSKIEEGKKEYDFVETDLAQLVAQQLENFKKDKLQREINVQAEIAENLPRLSVDQDALSQAFGNLLDNAVKFSRDLKEIGIVVKKDEENVIIEVQDKGIGVSQNELDKIFDKFYRGKNAVRQSVEGAGLGLTLVKHIVEAHGGRISVESKLGEGATFSLIIPFRRQGGEGSCLRKSSL